MKGGAEGWGWLVIGLLWLSLTGACTFNMARGDSYGFWVIGLYVVGIGLIPFFHGLKRVLGLRRTGLVLTVLASLGLVVALGLGAWALNSALAGMRRYHEPADEIVGPALGVLIFIIGPPSAFLAWGTSMLRAAKRSRPSAKRAEQEP